MLKLVGHYQTDNTNFLNVSQSGLHLVIGTRKKPTHQKPKNYLLQKVSHTKYIYISSLFEWQEMTDNGITAYSLDYQGEHYVLKVYKGTQKAEISLLLTATNYSISSINNMELGVKIAPNANI
jgi:hypothetical protein